ncbi:hypothetical protein [Nannocystis pusilla]|uniref:hypothetical protein n=1 Tax=Nannocystis pusilla TaxID=889268 RepID=UPI003B811A12
MRWFGFGLGLCVAWPHALAGPPELAAEARALPMALRSGAATVAHKSYTLHGIPVRGAFATMLSDKTGEREVAFSRPLAGPQLRPRRRGSRSARRRRSRPPTRTRRGPRSRALWSTR